MKIQMTGKGKGRLTNPLDWIFWSNFGEFIIHSLPIIVSTIIAVINNILDFAIDCSIEIFTNFYQTVRRTIIKHQCLVCAISIVIILAIYFASLSVSWQNYDFYMEKNIDPQATPPSVVVRQDYFSGENIIIPKKDWDAANELWQKEHPNY